MLEQYVYKNRKKLRCGYTTGSCAAAAAKAAAQMLLGGQRTETVELVTPSGQKLLLDVEEILQEKERVSCAIRKDSGDDPDITNGILIFASVEKAEDGFRLEGGTGVGRVTLPGLDQPVGEAAINTVPRRMITRAVEDICAQYGYTGGIRVLISIPEGVRLAGRTFNPRLGIEGGLSILGTTGIVEPMSEAALLDTIEVEMKQRAAQGWKKIILTPGNYGMDFLKEALHLDQEKSVKCSNYIGEALDKAVETGFESVLLVGHIGKLVKLGAGVMNTHSRWADARLETLASCAILAGGEAGTAAALLRSNTTEEALEILRGKGPFEETMTILLEKIAGHLEHRTGGSIQTEAVVFPINSVSWGKRPERIACFPGCSRKTDGNRSKWNQEQNDAKTNGEVEGYGIFCGSRSGSAGFNYSPGAGTAETGGYYYLRRLPGECAAAEGGACVLSDLQQRRHDAGGSGGGHGAGRTGRKNHRPPAHRGSQPVWSHPGADGSAGGSRYSL